MTYQAHGTEVSKKTPLRRLAFYVGISTFLLLVTVMLLGCTSDANERVERILDLHLRASELPSGWQRVSGGIGIRDQESEGIISRSVSFVGVPEQQVPGVLVKHEVIDYPSVTQATDGYREVVATIFPNGAWVWPEQMDFQSQADQIRVACLRSSSENSHCSCVAQYGHYVSIIHANVFEDKWLTMEDFERLLESIDARLAAATEEN